MKKVLLAINLSVLVVLVILAVIAFSTWEPNEVTISPGLPQGKAPERPVPAATPSVVAPQERIAEESITPADKPDVT
jgi:hypothetical protein